MLLSKPIDLLPSTAAPQWTSRKISALVDTGATISGVRRDLFKELELPLIGRVLVDTASETIETERVLAQVSTSGAGVDAPPFKKTGHFAVFNGTDELLLGMDFLKGGRLVVDLVEGWWEWTRE